MRSLIACLKLFAFFAVSLVLVPVQMAVLAIHKGKAAYIIPYYWQKCVCMIFGLKISVTGAPVKDRQVIYVSNHLSYLDIPVIGSVLKASFVAKKEVSDWPVFGFLSRLQQTAFIERTRNAAVKEADALDTMLENGKSLILFPEGTSTDGTEVVPFKSSLFSLALKNGENSQPIPVQPFALKILQVNGKEPENQDLRDLYAWHRDMKTELPEHLWRFAKSGGAHISLSFFPIIETSQQRDRKMLSAICYDMINRSIVPDKNMAA